MGVGPPRRRLGRYGGEMTVAELDLDLDVFSGPFDLLLALVLREEVDLLELSLADVVLAYLDHLEARGELDLEATTEFIVLVAALLELKSRLMLAATRRASCSTSSPSRRREELLARMLDARRFRAAAAHLRELLAREHGVRFREAAAAGRTCAAPRCPRRRARRSRLRSGAAIGRLLALPPTIDLRHIARPRVSVSERLAHLRALLRRGSSASTRRCAGADRMTVAVTLYALLELYKRGEAAGASRSASARSP